MNTSDGYSVCPDGYNFRDNNCIGGYSVCPDGNNMGDNTCKGINIIREEGTMKLEVKFLACCWVLQL